MHRAVYFSNVLGVEMGMFYKRRDYSTIVNGKNPIVAHEFLGSDVRGKDLIVVDDMISSGESMLDVARQLKERGAAASSCAPPSASSQTACRSSTTITKKDISTG